MLGSQWTTDAVLRLQQTRSNISVVGESTASVANIDFAAVNDIGTKITDSIYLTGDFDSGVEAANMTAVLDGLRLQWLLSDGAVSMAGGMRAYVAGVIARLSPRP